MKRILVAVTLLLMIGAGTWYWLANRPVQMKYKTVNVDQGNLLVTISATGTVEPEETVDVGAQVTGIISSFGKDADGKSIDYGSQLEANMVVARIDDKLFKADVTSAEATLAEDQAGVARAQADVQQSQAKLFQAQRDWERAQKLGPSDALSQVDYDTYQSTFEAAKANVAVSQASLKQAEAMVPQAEAALQRAQQNLSYCTIVSPVKGVVVDRRVNIGQTVVSSLSASSLFLIAKDLRNVTLWASVNEADIGKIKVGQEATFSVDAFPDRKFKGKVSRVRLNAAMTSNVVVYTVEIEADNSDYALIPYLTANIYFNVANHENVLLVPNGALRWSPSSSAAVSPDARDAFNAQNAAGADGGNHSGASGGGEGSSSNSSGRRGGQAAGGNPSTHPGEQHHRHAMQDGTLWVEDGKFVKPATVQVGATDGISTEIKTDALKAGDAVVVGEQTAAASSEETTNPFAPKFPNRRR